MKLDEYQWAINEMLSDKDYVYNSLTKDLYFLGKVLNRKYSILRNTYTVFMAGMIISVIAFAIAFNHQAREAKEEKAWAPPVEITIKESEINRA